MSATTGGLRKLLVSSLLVILCFGVLVMPALLLLGGESATTSLLSMIRTIAPFLIVLLLLLALFGLPLYLVIGGIALVSMIWKYDPSELNFSLFFTEGYGKLVDSPTLVSIPLFTFTGYLMAESKTGDRLVRLFSAMLGWMPGGLTIQIVVVCSFFTIFTGASGVTIIALGTLLYPVLLKSNYPEEYALGLLTASGSLGLLLPPSLPIIVYGVIAKTDITALFWAGIIPGTLMMLVLALHGMFVSTKQHVERTPFEWKELWFAFWDAKWEALLPIFVVVMMATQIVAIHEIAIVVTSYMFIVEVWFYKDLHLVKDIPRVCRLSLKLVGSIIIILMSALVLSDFLIGKEVPDAMFEVLRPYLTNKWMFLLVLNLFLILVGCLLDIFSAILVVVPLIVPLAKKFGVDPVHLGIIFLANLELGYMTPPVGINLFISSLTFKKPVLKLYRVSLPFLGILAVALLMITYIPALSLWLPEAVGAKEKVVPGKKSSKADLMDAIQSSEGADSDASSDEDEDDEDDEDDDDLDDLDDENGGGTDGGVKKSAAQKAPKVEKAALRDAPSKRPKTRKGEAPEVRKAANPPSVRGKKGVTKRPAPRRGEPKPRNMAPKSRSKTE